MSINTNNYEEYFLLYADNELSALEKNMVEDFVNQHPELEEELLMFKQSVIKPDDDCVMEDKKSLFKETKKFINHNNYEEILIMYHDNELNGWEREQTETFLLQNPKLGHELMILQKTKLVPDITITFPGKEVLYRKEGKVVPFKWWRSVAAAIIAAIGLWIGISYLQNDKDKLPVVVFGNDPVKKINAIDSIPVIEKLNEPVKNIVTENNKGKNISFQKAVVKNSAGKSSKIKHVPNIQLVKNQQSIVVTEPNINIKNIETGEQNIAINKVPELNDIKTIKKSDPEIVVTDELKHNDIAVNDKSVIPDNYAFTASYTPEEDENSNNYVFYNITKEEFNRTKLGGFLRKVKRTIERKSPFNNSKDDNEIVAKSHSKKL